ncbi:hypothetical protein [Streptomyces sp. NPDC097610]
MKSIRVRHLDVRPGTSPQPLQPCNAPNALTPHDETAGFYVKRPFG